MENTKSFDRRLRDLLIISGVRREELAARLGLSEETVEALRELAGSENEGVLTAVDDAVCAVIGAACAAYGEVLPLAEQLSRIAGEALALTNTNIEENL